MKRNKIAISAAIITAVALLLTGCGSGTGGTGGTSSTSQDGKGDVSGSIAVTWWGGDVRNQKTQAVIDMWKAENADVTVDVSSADFVKYFEKLNVQASSNSLPCVVQMQTRQIAEYAENSALLPLDPMIEGGTMDVSSIPEAVIDGVRSADGNLYFLPYGAAFDAVAVNTTLAQEAGVEVPGDGYTWKEYISFLTDASKNLPDGISAINDSGGKPTYFLAWLQANGIPVFDDSGKIGFTVDDLVQYWTIWDDMRTAGVTNSPSRAAEEPGVVDQFFVSSGGVMSDNVSANSLGTVQSTLDGKGTGQVATTLLMPSGSAGGGNAFFTSGFGIAKSCDNVPTAASFINFFTNDLEGGKS